MKGDLILILVELRNRFFFTQMFVHLIQVFVLYCEDSPSMPYDFNLKMRLCQMPSKCQEKLLSHQQWDFHEMQFVFH